MRDVISESSVFLSWKEDVRGEILSFDHLKQGFLTLFIGCSESELLFILLVGVLDLRNPLDQWKIVHPLFRENLL
jgi:hypothetical protein